jgi:putative ABC transport system permease protein
MTTLAPRAALGRTRAGGVPARRALMRWSWRMFRREWRQQVLVLALLAIAVAAATASVAIVHTAVPADDAEFGTADHILTFDGGDPRKLAAGLARARRTFGTIDVIGHRSVPVPGAVDSVDVRAQSPDGAYGAGLLALRHGSYPVWPGQVAVTDGVARLLRLHIGATLALDGHRRTVVGIVENPRDLNDEFALVSPSSAPAPDHVAVLVSADEQTIDSFFGGRSGPGAPGLIGTMSRGDDHPGADTLAMFSVSTVFLLLASLVAAAGFAVVAQRRLRQLGMLTAVGATRKHLRLVLMTNGALVGAIAALVGTLAGVALWVLAAPTLESTIGHRIGRLDLPWGLIAATVLLAVLGAVAAAWWPGRAVARLPVMLALSGRPPKPRPARHAAAAAGVLLAVGVGCLALSHRDRPPLIIAGIVATISGCLLLGPAAIRSFSGLAGRVAIAPRLALRDLVRYQARSGAALAAVSLALGIAATVVVTASAEQAKRVEAPPNLTDRQIRIYMGPAQARELTPVQTPGQLASQTAGAAQLAAQLGHATVTPLRQASQPGAPPVAVGNARALQPIEITRPIRSASGRTMYRVVSQLYVATPAVLSYLGVDPAAIEPGADFLVDPSVRTGQLVIPSLTSRQKIPVTNVQRIATRGHLFGGEENARRPASFITLAGLRRHGWKQAPAGWLVEARRPLTENQIADARDAAAKAGLSIEVQRQKDAWLTRAIAIATAAGALLALAILALTVGLIRGESAGDLRTLTATGAGSGVRRTLTATTAGALALLGALIGVAGAYVVLAALHWDDVGYLSDVPVLYLAFAIVGLPVAAAAAGWLVAGREPPAIARPVID